MDGRTEFQNETQKMEEVGDVISPSADENERWGNRLHTWFWGICLCSALRLRAASFDFVVMVGCFASRRAVIRSFATRQMRNQSMLVSELCRLLLVEINIGNWGERISKPTLSCASWSGTSSTLTIKLILITVYQYPVNFPFTSNYNWTTTTYNID